ncbi:MAG TPA: helix-turn-helix transcriptional regulator [Candidatus Avilachnospira avicola]|nr:helix-turn-helix transcriptional regulator [Candidatus Avilachnospira avicola]
MRLDTKRLYTAMARACMTAAEVQESSGVPRGTYIKAVAGKNVRPATAGKIAKALHCDVLELLTEEGNAS